MRLIDADELMEHVWRDKLDSRELIAEMIDNAPTVKEIPTKIPINIFEQLISQRLKTGKWITEYEIIKYDGCEEHNPRTRCSICNAEYDTYSSHFMNFCPRCGAKMEVSE